MVVLKLMRLVLIIIAFLVTFFPIYINVSAFAIQTKDSTYKIHFTNPCLAKEMSIAKTILGGETPKKMALFKKEDSGE